MTATALTAGALVGVAGICCRRGVDHARSARVRRRFGAAHVGPARPRWLPAPPAWLAAALTDAAVPLDPDRAWSMWLAAVAVGAAAGVAVGGLVLAVLAAAVAAFAPVLLLRSGRGRSEARLEAGLPGALEAVARGLRSGASLRQAVTEAASTTPGILGDELATVAADAAHGASLVTALEAMAVRCPLPGVGLAVTALCLGAETGGAQARAVDGVAATLRERLAVAGEVRALSAQTRASMIVIALAPLAFSAFASATDHRTSTFLFRTPVGLGCVVAGVGLDAAGACWMRRLSRVVA